MSLKKYHERGIGSIKELIYFYKGTKRRLTIDIKQFFSGKQSKMGLNQRQALYQEGLTFYLIQKNQITFVIVHPHYHFRSSLLLRRSISARRLEGSISAAVISVNLRSVSIM